jgi:UDP-glucose 4-epimerase
MPGSDSASPRILLTGSSGVLGFHVLAQLAARGEKEILTLARAERDIVAPDSFRHRVIDFKNREQLTAVFQSFRPTCVIHCAGSSMIFPSVEWFDLVRFNVDATLALFEQAAALPGCHFIHVSTGLAYRETGRPLSELDALENIHPYGASKAAADLLLRSAAHEFGAPLTLFRPFSFTGLNDNRTRLFPSILRAASEDRPAELSPGDQVRDFCSARDIAHGIVRAVDRPPPPGSPSVINLGSGQSVALRKTIERVVQALQIPVTLQFGAKGYGPTEPMHLVADIGRAQRELDWTPRHQLAHAVWELAAAAFPGLRLRQPEELLPRP